MILLVSRPRMNEKTKIYEYRRRVPEDLRALLGKREEKKSLGTRDPDRARLLHAMYHAKVEERWRLLREGVRHLDQKQCEALAGEIYAQVIEEYQGPQKGSHWPLCVTNLYGLEVADGDIPRPHHNSSRPYSDELEELHGARLDALLAGRGLIVDDASRKNLLSAVQRAVKQATRIAVAQKVDGDFSPDPQASRYPEFSDKPGPDSLPLMKLFDMWVAARKPAEETVPAWRANIEKFIAHSRTEDALKIKHAHVKKWRDSLREQGIGGVRIRDGYLAALKAVLGWAANEEHLASNPAMGVKVTVPRTERRREKDLRDDEVYLILKSAMGPHDGAESEDTKAARRWVPWLCAYSGARISEMTGLHAEHVIHEHGIDGIHIAKSKTGLARKIPLHPHLIEQGFLKFVHTHGPGPLFFTQSRTRPGILRGHRTRGEGLAEWIRDVGVSDEDVSPNHGWRHRFRTEAQRIGMRDRYIDYIQGHAPRTEGEKYGHLPLDVLAPWISMLPRYDVSGDSLRIDRKIPKQLLQRAVKMLSATQM
jgi:integrase